MKGKLEKYIFTIYRFKLNRNNSKLTYNVQILSCERGEDFDY